MDEHARPRRQLAVGEQASVRSHRRNAEARAEVE
jgi:hypothetical protein